jgi:hypothetical protein
MKQKPSWVGEIKWSDRIEKKPNDETKSVRHLLRNHKSIRDGFFTTRTYEGKITIEGRKIDIVPTALYCYTVGRNITAPLEESAVPALNDTPETEAAE